MHADIAPGEKWDGHKTATRTQKARDEANARADHGHPHRTGHITSWLWLLPLEHLPGGVAHEETKKGRQERFFEHPSKMGPRKRSNKGAQAHGTEQISAHRPMPIVGQRAGH